MTAGGAAPRLGHRPALDGIRALAILLVVGHHTAAFLLPGHVDDLLPAGFLGVDVFLVLSGFLITTLLLERRERERRPIATFYARRALRLLPAVLALLAGLLLYTGLTEGFGDAARTLPWVLLYVTNWAELGGATVSHYVTHLWSLAIEEQFYLVWPVLLYGLLRLGASERAVGALAVGATVAVVLWRVHLWDAGEGWLRIYLRTDARADALLVGAALAVAWRGGALARVGGAAAGAAGALALAGILATAELVEPSAAGLYLGGFTLVALAVAVLIATTLDGRSAVARALSTRPAVALGRVSYALYLWHFPVFAVVAERTPGWAGPPRVLVAWALALGLSVASYRLVERPALALKDRLGTARRPAGGPAPGAPQGATP